MIKNNLLLFCILSSFDLYAKDASSSDLFDQAFKNKKTNIEKIQLALIYKDINLGEVDVEIKDDKITSINTYSLVQSLKKVLIESEVEKIVKLKKEKIKFEEVESFLSFNKNELSLILQVSDYKIKPTENYYREALLPYYHHVAITPSKLSGIFNWKLEENINQKEYGPSYLNGFFNLFLNYDSFVVDHQFQYNSSNKSQWYRNHTSLFKDDTSNGIRYVFGDTTNNLLGYMAGKSLLGLSISKDYSLNPYQVSSPSSSQSFTVDNRSLVRYYVNNALLKSEYLKNGKYSIKDLPLNNGVNKVLIEVEDELGNRKIFNFNESYSNDLLNEGQSKFDLSLGKTASEDSDIKRYDKKSDIFSSAFYKRGWTKKFTNGFYFQNYSNFKLSGIENVFSSNFGNVGLGTARTDHGNFVGSSNILNYSLNFYSNLLQNFHNLNIKAELRDRNFYENVDFNQSRYRTTYQINYTLPVMNLASLSISSNIAKPFNQNLNDKVGVDLSLTSRLYKTSTLTLYASQFKDEYKIINKLFYAFINITFDEGRSFASLNYDSNSKSKRVSYYHDNGDKINNFKMNSTLEENESNKSGNLDFSLSNKYLEYGIRQSANKTNRQTYSGTSLRVLSAFSFATNENDFGVGVSRPIQNSFSIFRPDKNLKNEVIALKSNSNRNEEENGIFKNLVYRDLVPYQYKQVQLDTSKLSEGIALTKESFILYPTYKSGHLINIKAKGLVAIKGKILGLKNELKSLIVGEVIDDENQSTQFFTNKNGQFFIEGIKRGKLKFIINEDKIVCEASVAEQSSGIVNLGEIKCK